MQCDNLAQHVCGLVAYGMRVGIVVEGYPSKTKSGELAIYPNQGTSI
jgi:hypothetical protein